MWFLVCTEGVAGVGGVMNSVVGGDGTIGGEEDPAGGGGLW